jgi:uncharacterized protein YdeI (YjbR/CyaY-like superfamily)
MADDSDLILAEAAAWRRWLGEHHATSPGVWLVLAKKAVTQPTSLTYAEALEEALCHGWIDGQTGVRDSTTFRRRFTPRRPRSRWSARNVEIIGALRAQGRMLPAGEAEVERAQRDGRWDVAYSGSAAIEVPADLAAALSDHPEARAMFDILTSQNRYAILFRIGGAKQAATRARRIEEFVAMLERGETVHPQKRTL